MLGACSLREAPMSLRKSPTRTPALLAALRSNAQKSTGPRSAQGKAHSRLNALRHGGRSRYQMYIWDTLMAAPPCQVAAWARRIMTPAMLMNPVLHETAQLLIDAECANVKWHIYFRSHRGPLAGQRRDLEQTKQECY